MQEENKKLKSKQREKMQPKMGKLDIDYQVLHDAFFKHQTKPNLTVMGDLYYEGKEYEARVRLPGLPKSRHIDSVVLYEDVEHFKYVSKLLKKPNASQIR